MTAVVPTDLSNLRNINGAGDGSSLTGRYALVRTGTAQADTGQTDWIWVPNWARAMVVYLNVSAVTGASPNILPQVVVTDPVILDTKAASSGGGGTGTTNLGQSSLTGGITSTGNVCITCMPGETGIADKIAVATSGNSVISINCNLPSVVGLKLAMTHTNETYTYTLGVEFYGKEKVNFS